MKGLGIVLNWQKRREAGDMVKRILAFCRQHQIAVYLAESTEAGPVEGMELLRPEEFAGHADAVIVLGGDGTILRAAHLFKGTSLPLLGVNLGQMGFLTEVEPPLLEAALQQLLDGDYRIRYCLMLSALVYRDERVIAEYTALNDVVISRGSSSRIVYLDTYVNNKHLETYPSDGIIIATPTGSTGYSLSAGGPIVNPALDVMIITPICPHLLHHRSVIVSSSERVSVHPWTKQADIQLIVDGQIVLTLQDNDIVQVTRSPLTTQLIELQGTDFYTLLHHKLSKVISREPERM